VRTCQPTYIESAFADDALKNRICNPIAPPIVPRDWLRMLQVELSNRRCWAEYPEIDARMAGSRLDPFAKSARVRSGVDGEATEYLQRHPSNIAPATSKLEDFLSQ